MPVSTAVTRARSLFNDADGDGQPDPGDIFLHTITITNSGDTDALAVVDTESENGLTINPGSVQIGPVAFDDVFNITGNTPVTITTAQLLGNDVDPDGPEASLVISGVSAGTNGVLVDNANGTYTFTPTTGFTGTASFTYSITDAQGISSVAVTPGTATINVSGLVWYVDSAAAPGGDGSFANPFQSLTPLSTGGSADGLDGAGDTIFVYDRGLNAYNSGIVLENNQVLRGDGQAFVVNGLSIGASASNSTIEYTTFGVQLAEGNTITGLNFAGEAAGATGIVDGSGTVGTLNVSSVAVSGQGKAIDIDQGGTLNVTLTSLGSTGSNSGGLDLAGVSGSFTVQGATSITGTTVGPGINVSGSNNLAVAFQGATTVNTGAVTAVNLASNTGTSTVSFSAGLDIDTTSGAGLLSSGGGALNVSGGTNSINTTTGQILSLANMSVGGSNASFNTLAASGTVANTAILLNNVDGGTFNGGNVTIAGTSGGGDGINIQGGSAATFNFASATIDNASGDGIEIAGAGNGVVTFSTIDLDGMTGNGLSISGATNAVNVTTGTIGGSNDPGGDAVNITGGTAGMAIGAAITKTTAGNIVEISGHSSGTITLSGNLSATGGVNNGILLQNNPTGTIIFSGTSKVLSTGTSTAFNSDNTDGAVQILNGGLDIDTTTGTGLSASGGGTLLISGTGNHVTATTGRAVNIDGTTSAGITLQDVSKSGGTTTAIFLNNAGSGGFTITGTNSDAGSGGTIQNVGGTSGENISGIGVFIGSTNNVSLSNMNFTGPFGNFAIKGNTVNNFTLRDSTISDALFTIGNSTAFDEGAIRFDNLSGVGLFEGNNISGALETTMSIVNTAGTLNLFIRDSASDQAVFGRNSTASGDDHVNVETQNDANLLMLVDGVQFGGNAASGLGWRGDAIQTIAVGTSNHEVTIRNSVFDNNHSNIVSAGGIGVLIGGTAGGGGWGVDYTIQNNQFTGSSGYAIAASFNGGPGTARGLITGNTVGTPSGGGAADASQENVGSSGGAGGIFVSAERSGGGSGELAQFVTISNNTIRDIIGGAGIFVRAVTGSHPQFARVEATINNNSVDEMGGNAFAAFRALAGGNNPDLSQVGLDVNNNTFNADTVNDNSAYGAVMLDQVIGNGGQYYFPGYSGDDGDNVQPGLNGSEDIEAYLLGRGNTLVNDNVPITLNVGQLVYAVDAVMNAGALQAAQTGSNTGLPTGAMMVAPAPGAPLDAGTLAAPEAPSGRGGGWGGGIIPRPWGDVSVEWVIDEFLPRVFARKAVPGTVSPPAPQPAAAAGDDPAAATAAPDSPASSPIVDDGILSTSELQDLVDAAIQRWAAAGASPAQVAAMRATAFEIADMTGLYLGTTDGRTILIDSDGGGHGWFLDTTPGDDGEYGGSGSRLSATAGGPADGRIDLLTVLMHELGHRIGIADDFNSNGADDLMFGYAHLGERRLPQSGDLVAAGLDPVGHAAFVLVLPSVGTLPATQAVEIRFNSTVNNFTNQVIPDFNNTSSVSGSNFTTVVSSNELLDVDSLTLGDFIFNDLNANGLFDGVDPGIAGVTLTLFADDGDGVLDAGDTSIATTVTGGGGTYSFANLAPGSYIVRIDASNFGPGGALDGKVSTLGSSDPDDNINNDDNGLVGAGGVVASQAITLSYNGETVADGTGKLDINDRLDFGFATLNTAPVNTVGAAVALDEDDIDIELGGISVADAEAGSGNISVTFEVAHGALEIRTDVAGGINAADIAFQDADTIQIVAPQGEINLTLAALGGLTYTPDANFNGIDNLTVTTSDLGLSGLDPGATGTATDEQDQDVRALNVASVNDAPSGSDDTIAAIENVPYEFHNVDFGFSDPADGDGLLEVIINSVANGTLYIDTNLNGPEAGEEVTVFPQTVSAAAIAAGQLLFVPNVGATTAALVFQVRDDGGVLNGGVDLDGSANTLTFNVSVANTAAVAVDDADSTDENLVATGNVFDPNPTTADSDTDGPALQVAAVNGSGALVGNAITLASGALLTVNADGSYSYDPNGRFNYLITAAKALATGAVNVSATDSFTYTLLNGNTATVTITINGVESADDQLRGDGAGNNVTGLTGNDFIDLSQGGDDSAAGGDGDDAIYLGGAMTSADVITGDVGDDQLGLQGDYSGGLTLNPGVIIDTIVLLDGADTRFGDPGTSFYSYFITTVNGNVAPGGTLIINSNQLRVGENFIFDGSAETDGGFILYTGGGDNDLTGGDQSDGFFFGSGTFDANDVVDGGPGPDDQVAFFGNYVIVFTATQLIEIETIVPLSGPDRGQPFFSYSLTMNDGNVLAGEQMTVNAAQLKPAESLTLDGSAETDGSFRLIGGYGNDILIGSQGNDLIFGNPGDDLITGEGGADTLTGMAGADTFIYNDKSESTGLARDIIADFAVGDLIDLSAIDADETSGVDAFTFIGSAAFSSTAGQLRAFEDVGQPGRWFVEGDVDGDGLADFALQVTVADFDPVTASDFIL